MLLDYLRYHEDFGEIIDIVDSSSFEKALKLKIFNNVIRLPGPKEVEGRWCLPQGTRHGPAVKVFPSTKKYIFAG
jgi:hypothetical protein